jgi:hypothetical protein
MSIVLMGSTSGSVTLAEPAVAGSTVLDLPATSGTVGLTVSQISMKNRIINGGMTIDQRNAGASVNNTAAGLGTYTLDRWLSYGTAATKFSIQQNAGSVTPPAGFINYLGVTSLAATTVGSTDLYYITQRIEGFNTYDLSWGTANAQTVTLSFWARSSLTGTFGGALVNSAGTRSYPFTYTISSANTWTKISITVVGETTGAWLKNNEIGIGVVFGLGVGSTFSTTAGAWATGTFVSATGAVSVVGTNGATFYITGVQLELGSAATTFDFSSYGNELASCQRYYYVGQNASYGYPSPNSGGYASVQRYDFKVTMRTAATVTTSYTFQSNISAINTGTRTNDFFTDQIVSTVTTNTTWLASYTASAEL